MPFALHRSLPFLILAACCAALPSARAAPTLSDQAALAPGEYRWLDEGPWTGPIYLVISIDRQMVHVYDGDRLIGVAAVSTGMKGHRTPTGDFPILQKRQWHRSNIYSNAPMPFMQRLTWDGIALHAGHNPGYPASHGCIRLPYAFARRLFDLTSIGTQVSVTTDRLAPVLMVNSQLLVDPDDPASALVTFTPREEVALAERSPMPSEIAVAPRRMERPVLEVDPAVFQPRLSR